MRARKILVPACAVVLIFAAGGVTALAASNNWSVADAFDYTFQSNGRIEYDYESDGDLSGENDIVLDADDIKVLNKRSELTLYGDFEADLDDQGSGTLYIRIGDNPENR